ncbi:apolipoprotein A-I-like [Hyperolius riggenbachi]|uniref:apolipoprotein A-I-like n=1 Tax=Hyperolius riggenbachi TaxID=752182 RepID=UPI0035A35E2E
MKSLALLLLLCIGIQGYSIVQQDEPQSPQPKKPGVRESAKNLFRDFYLVGAESAAALYHEDPQEKLKHLSKTGSILTHAFNLLEAIGESISEIRTEVQKEIHEKYPTYSTEVLPLYKEYNQIVIEYTWSLKEELAPYFTETFEEISKQLQKFQGQVSAVFKKHELQFKSFQENLIDKVKPFAEKIHKELEAEEQQETGRGQSAKTDEDPSTKYKEIVHGGLPHKAEDAIKMIEKLKELSSKIRYSVVEEQEQ